MRSKKKIMLTAHWIFFSILRLLIGLDAIAICIAQITEQHETINTSIEHFADRILITTIKICNPMTAL